MICNWRYIGGIRMLVGVSLAITLGGIASAQIVPTLPGSSNTTIQEVTPSTPVPLDASPVAPTVSAPLVSQPLVSQPVVTPSVTAAELGGRPRSVTVKVRKDGKTFYGKPLATDGKQMAVLRWDGRLATFPVNDPSIKVTKYSSDFKPYSTSELKQRLKKYFGNRYEISTTGHFVVIHPNGGTEFWAEPFERHYRQLNDYFQAHGFETSEAKFPLVAIVLRSRKEFDLRLDKEAGYDRNVLGYYSKKSNRITTFAPNGIRWTPTGAKKMENWLENSPTIIHEVAHQIAFNCGVHNRFSVVPKWTSEGLAMLCETRGVYNFAKYPHVKDRVNRLRLKSFRQLEAAGKTKGVLLELLQRDRMFESDPEVAYAVSWAISFYLNENRQMEYLNYLAKDGRRGDFRAHTKIDRVGFFIRHFGKDIASLEQRMNLFVGAIK